MAEYVSIAREAPPNPQMRKHARALLAGFDRFKNNVPISARECAVKPVVRIVGSSLRRHVVGFFLSHSPPADPIQVLFFFCIKKPKVLPRLAHTVFLYEYAAEFVGISVIAC